MKLLSIISLIIAVSVPLSLSAKTEQEALSIWDGYLAKGKQAHYEGKSDDALDEDGKKTRERSIREDKIFTQKSQPPYKIASSLHGKNINDLAINLYLEGHCAINSELNSKCFNITENQCRTIFANLTTECSQNPNGFPVDIDDPAAQAKFGDCLGKKFENYLINSGIDMDAPCVN